MTRQQFEVYLLGMRIEIAPTKIVGIVEIGPSSFNEVENSGAKFGRHGQFNYRFASK